MLLYLLIILIFEECGCQCRHVRAGHCRGKLNQVFLLIFFFLDILTSIIIKLSINLISQFSSQNKEVPPKTKSVFSKTQLGKFTKAPNQKIPLKTKQGNSHNVWQRNEKVHQVPGLDRLSGIVSLYPLFEAFLNFFWKFLAENVWMRVWREEVRWGSAEMWGRPRHILAEQVLELFLSLWQRFRFFEVKSAFKIYMQMKFDFITNIDGWSSPFLIQTTWFRLGRQLIWRYYLYRRYVILNIDCRITEFNCTFSIIMNIKIW